MRKLFFALTVVAVLCASAVAYAAQEPDLSGVISEVNYTDGTFFVEGTTVYTTEETIITANAVAILFSDLADGDSVKVFGEVVDGQFIARKVCKLLLLKDGSGKEIMEG
jgi:hypothetical protein